MTFTVLQPAIFMQTMQGGWNEIIRTGKFALPYSRRVKTCYVDFRDVAEVAAQAFVSEKLDNGTFELCAPGSFNRVEIAALMSEALEVRIEAGELSFDVWADAAGVPEGHVRSGLKRMYADYNQHGFQGGNATVLKCLLDREPRTLRQFFKELVLRRSIAA
jgi:uncharacterized protein YbjT (DUF2867 family)